VSAWSHLLLLYLHAVDGWLHYGHEHHYPILSKFLHPWKEYKATLVFAVELQAQAIQFLFYLAFFGIVLTYYGMPINLFREVYMSFAALKERLGSFLKYRRLMANMSRFENASEQQLEGGRICIICRDEMSTQDSKQLPVCCHVFHKSCLREWLVQQQSCPTCRSDIAAMSAQEAARNAAAQAAQQREQQVPPEPAAAVTGQVTDQSPAQRDFKEGGVNWDTSIGGGTKTDQVELHGDRPDKQHGLSVPPSHPATVLPAPSSEQIMDGQILLDQVGTTLSSSSSAPWSWFYNFPSLYRVVRAEGSAVWLDDHVVRVIPQGTVVLCLAISQDEQGVLFLKIPDGWVPEEDVLKINVIKRAA
jgi:E3 ubiquitin-protein ligase synoviolin